LNLIDVLGILIAIAVFVLANIFWMMFPYPLGFILGIITGILLAAPIIVAFRILAKRRSKS